MYLGYQYQNQLSILMSRITLHLQKECKFYFSVAIDNTDFTLQGFSLSQYVLPVELIEDMIQDLPCIFFNYMNSSEGENFFIICKDETGVEAWYNAMREGHIATRVIRQFGTDNWDDKREAINLYKEELAATTPIFFKKKQTQRVDA